MKKTVFFVGLLFNLFGALMAHAQNPTLEKLKEKHEVIVDTVDGKEIYYIDMSQKSIDKLKATREKEVNNLIQKKKDYELKQKEELKEYVESVNRSLQENKITQARAEELKTSRAGEIANKIDIHNKMIDAQIAFAQVRGTTVVGDSKFELSTKNGLTIEMNNSNGDLKKYKRTETGLSLGFAYNFMIGDDLDINDFSYPKNNYFSVGYQWKTTLDKDTNNFRLLYGIEYQSHGTQLNGNRFFTQGEQTQIEPIGFNVDKAKFRQDQLVFPVHLEIGGSKRKDYEDGRVRFDNSDYWKVGLGGFAGFNMSSRLKLKYEIDGRNIKETRVNNFDNEKFVYGLDAYVGRGEFTFFGRMNLNKVFNNNSVDAQYVTFGIRFQ